MDVRPATTADLDAVVRLAEIVDPPPSGSDIDRGYYASIIEHGHLTIAEANGIVIGYAGAIPVAGGCHLTDLFVHPDAHGRGVGGRLLDAVWGAPVTEVPRQTFSSVHPSALPLYIRAGMQPRWPLLLLEGDAGALPRSPLRHRTVDSGAAAALEQDWLGWDRAAQYRYWATLPGARTFTVLDGDAPVAVGCLSRSRVRHTLVHLAAADTSVLGEAVTAAAALAAGPMMVAAPGMSSCVGLLLGAGWRVVDHDLYCASRPGLFDAERLVPHPGLL